MTRDATPKPQDDAAVEPKAAEAAGPTELSDQELDPASGGGWPYLTTSHNPGGLLGG